LPPLRCGSRSLLRPHSQTEERGCSLGSLIQSVSQYFIGAALMVAGGVVEAIFGVKAERQSLESLAMPLTAEDVEETGSQAEVTAKS
jgi:hypothetical protein